MITVVIVIMVLVGTLVKLFSCRQPLKSNSSQCRVVCLSTVCAKNTIPKRGVSNFEGFRVYMDSKLTWAYRDRIRIVEGLRLRDSSALPITKTRTSDRIHCLENRPLLYALSILKTRRTERDHQFGTYPQHVYNPCMTSALPAHTNRVESVSFCIYSLQTQR